ncbi:ribosomal protein S18-alanine N-acetyltransferase [Primorskyibacter aestuariivivens]|uniref:ribosomal protein S18-alanine N-acetyltransferase n=1 Tax=Primorskyibacter aestuariivivens TaxID=1888912 RepID=UPI0023014920|nr:ribosomal protein S18-alanine N-acetyltransferase [Primorskyibacter aestuariivivens]MDA7429325.1 ribosomal protein S18-alanine N-acetyltransferase [Primorskyibacter aestuariivivens]
MTPEALAGLHGRVFERGWSAADFAAYRDDPACVLIARPEGFALARVTLDEAEILTIATAPEQRRKGIARLLLADLLDRVSTRGARHIFLEVAADNAPARALYDAAGFKQIAVRKGYYPRHDGPPADALVLRKPLP